MPRQTSVNISVENPQSGTIRTDSGPLVGDRNRTVVLTAVPAPGYKFSEWQIEEYPMRLFPANFIQRYSTEVEVCANASSEMPIGELFYIGQSDGKLYTTPDGDVLVPDGLWYIGNYNYISITGGVPGVIQQCSDFTRGNRGGGGDGGGGGGGGGGTIDLQI